MTDRELMQQALDALEDLHRTGDTQVFDMCYAPKLLPALRARLAQPEQEPPCKTGSQCVGGKCERCAVQEWQGLTDEEIKNHWLIAMQSVEGTVLPIPEFALAIERALKEKNHG